MLWTLLIAWGISAVLLALAFCKAAAKTPPLRQPDDFTREQAAWDAWYATHDERTGAPVSTTVTATERQAS